MIYERLQVGRENARSAIELAEELHTDLRGIAMLVREERMAGKPICAACSRKTPGYYIPATREEMAQYCVTLQRKASALVDTFVLCTKAMRHMERK